MSDTLPTEEGWYEADEYPLNGFFDPYVLRDGQWYEANQDGWTELSDDRMLEDFSPLRRLVLDFTERGE